MAASVNDRIALTGHRTTFEMGAQGDKEVMQCKAVSGKGEYQNSRTIGNLTYLHRLRNPPRTPQRLLLLLSRR